MYRCIVILRNLEEAETLTDLINKYKQRPENPVWQDNFWKSNFKARQDWGVDITIEGPKKIKHFSYCDMPWYENHPPYWNEDFIHLEEFIEILETEKPEPEPFIRPITIEEVYNGLK